MNNLEPLSLLFNFTPAWISNQRPSKVWGEINYPLQNFNAYTVEFGGLHISSMDGQKSDWLTSYLTVYNTTKRTS